MPKRKKKDEIPAGTCDYCGADIPAGKGILVVAPIREGNEYKVHRLRFCNWRELFTFVIFLVHSEWDATKAAAQLLADPGDMMFM